MTVEWKVNYFDQRSCRRDKVHEEPLNNFMLFWRSFFMEGWKCKFVCLFTRICMQRDKQKSNRIEYQKSKAFKRPKNCHKSQGCSVILTYFCFIFWKKHRKLVVRSERLRVPQQRYSAVSATSPPENAYARGHLCPLVTLFFLHPRHIVTSI